LREAQLKSELRNYCNTHAFGFVEFVMFKNNL